MDSLSSEKNRRESSQVMGRWQQTHFVSLSPVVGFSPSLQYLSGYFAHVPASPGSETNRMMLGGKGLKRSSLCGRAKVLCSFRSEGKIKRRTEQFPLVLEYAVCIYLYVFCGASTANLLDKLTGRFCGFQTVGLIYC